LSRRPEPDAHDAEMSTPGDDVGTLQASVLAAPAGMVL